MAEPISFVRSPVRVKICGLTSVAESLECARAGADWIGLNFYPSSPRRVDPSVAAEIVSALPPSCKAVGLFVDRSPDEVAEVCARLGLTIAQLHGNEPPHHLVTLGHLHLIRAFRLGDSASIDRMTTYLRHAADLGRVPDAVLVDAHIQGRIGGTGHAINQDLLALLPNHPHLILAGGLTPENVAQRVAIVRPWMVDVATGVEASPGRKDTALVHAFIQSAKFQ